MELKKYFAAIVVLLLLLIAPTYLLAAGSAAISLSPQAESYKVGQTFTATISVDPGTEKIDMVRAKLTFPSDLLEIKNFSASPTFGYQAGSNGFDNTTGNFSWGAGAPGGISTPNTFGTIVFSVKKAGNAKIEINQDSLVLSDGQNKFNGQLGSSDYSLLAAAVAKPSAKKIQPLTTGNKVQSSVVVSQPFENNNVVETKIIPQPQSRNFTASLIDSLRIALTSGLWIVLLALLLIIISVKTIYKARKNSTVVLKNKQ